MNDIQFLGICLIGNILIMVFVPIAIWWACSSLEDVK